MFASSVLSRFSALVRFALLYLDIRASRSAGIYSRLTPEVAASASIIKSLGLTSICPGLWFSFVIDYFPLNISNKFFIIFI